MATGRIHVTLDSSLNPFSVSGALWNSILPGKLRLHLPEAEQDKASAIFRSIAVAQQYESGSSIRGAINESYRETQQILAIASVSISAPLLIVMLFIRNVKLAEADSERDTIAKAQLAAANEAPEGVSNSHRAGEK